MRSFRITQNTPVIAILFILCILVPQYAAAPTLESFPSQKKSLLWRKPSRYVYGRAEATFPTLEDAATNALSLPTWEKVLAYGKEFLKVADENLNAAARELHITKKIDDFRTTLNAIVGVSAEMHEDMTELTQQGLTLDQVSDELGFIFSDILDHLKEAIVTSTLDTAEEALLEFARKHGMSENGQKRLRGSFDRLRPHVEKLVDITSDLINRHPILSGALVFSAAVVLIPESWFLRPLLGLFGFDPSGPIMGSPAALAQRFLWGATVEEGSWFAILQRAGMNGFSARPIMGAIGSTFPYCLARSFHSRIMLQG